MDNGVAYQEARAEIDKLKQFIRNIQLTREQCAELFEIYPDVLDDAFFDVLGKSTKEVDANNDIVPPMKQCPSCGIFHGGKRCMDCEMKGRGK